MPLLWNCTIKQLKNKSLIKWNNSVLQVVFLFAFCFGFSFIPLWFLTPKGPKICQNEMFSEWRYRQNRNMFVQMMLPFQNYLKFNLFFLQSFISSLLLDFLSNCLCYREQWNISFFFSFFLFSVLLSCNTATKTTLKQINLLNRNKFPPWFYALVSGLEESLYISSCLVAALRLAFVFPLWNNLKLPRGPTAHIAIATQS